MALREEMIKTGNFLFRWRSYLPLVLIVVIFLGLIDFNYPFGRHSLDFIWEMICLLVAFAGLGIRIYTIGHVPIGTSGRNTKQQEASCLNTTGIYSIVRHPLYLGNFIIWFAISLFLHQWWISIIFILIFWLYYERIMLAEEDYLQNKFGDEFTEWAAITPAFIPKISGWKSSNLPFSWKFVLKKEYSGFYAIMVIFTFLEIAGDLFSGHGFIFDPIWIIMIAGSTVVYLTIRFLKKKTNILDVNDR